MSRLADVGSHIDPGAFWLLALLGLLALALGVGVMAYRDHQREREAQAARLRRIIAQMDAIAAVRKSAPYDQEADQ